MVAGRTVKTAPREGKREAKNHLMTLKRVLRHALTRVERSRCTVAGAKPVFTTSSVTLSEVPSSKKTCRAETARSTD